jgi:hypothetical protein
MSRFLGEWSDQNEKTRMGPWIHSVVLSASPRSAAGISPRKSAYRKLHARWVSYPKIKRQVKLPEDNFSTTAGIHFRD